VVPNVIDVTRLGIDPGITIRIGNGWGVVSGNNPINEGTLLSEVDRGVLVVKGPALLDNYGTVRARNWVAGGARPA